LLRGLQDDEVFAQVFNKIVEVKECDAIKVQSSNAVGQ
jgi:hypothetical protein